MKRVLCGFRLFDDSKQMLSIIKDDYGVKSLSAVINEFLYYVSHGIAMPGGSFDVPKFLQDVTTLKYADKEHLRIQIRDSKIYDEYIQCLEENGIADYILEKSIDLPMQDVVSQYPDIVLNIRNLILERFSDPLTKREVLSLMNYWYERSVKSGRLKELVKDQILEENRKRDEARAKRDMEEARANREHIGYYAEVSE